MWCKAVGQHIVNNEHCEVMPCYTCLLVSMMDTKRYTVPIFPIILKEATCHKIVILTE